MFVQDVGTSNCDHNREVAASNSDRCPDKFHCITNISACHVNTHSPVYCVLTILVSVFMKQLAKPIIIYINL